MTSEQRQALARFLDDDALVDAIHEICMEECATSTNRLIDATQGNAEVRYLVQEGTRARTYFEFVAMLRRRLEV